MINPEQKTEAEINELLEEGVQHRNLGDREKAANTFQSAQKYLFFSDLPQAIKRTKFNEIRQQLFELDKVSVQSP